MTRKGRGGRRTGKGGKAYENRSDLNKAAPPMATSGGVYGDRKETVDAQKAVPMAGGKPSTGPLPKGPVPNTGGGAPVPPTGAHAGTLMARQALPNMTGPSGRPGEPVTAGLASGPGPGPEALGLPMGGPSAAQDLPEVEMLLAIYRQHPTAALGRLIERVGR